MSILIPHIAFVVNEGLVAVMIAVIGPGVTLLIARWTAKRQEHKDDNDDEFRFRGELSGDNQALRTEIKDLKAELKEKNEYIKRLEKELRFEDQ
jgi:predicted nuclease with TOPRIM domain